MAKLEQELCQKIRELCYKEGDFTLTSGQKSTFYVDIKSASLHPKVVSLIAELAWQKLNPRDYVGVGGPTLGADPLATALSLQALKQGMELPAFILRKEPKKHGRSLWIEGRDLLPATGGELLVVEDVVTTGGSSIKSVERLREEGFEVKTILAVLDRLQGAQAAMKEKGIRLVSLTTIAQIQNLK